MNSYNPRVSVAHNFIRKQLSEQGLVELAYSHEGKVDRGVKPYVPGRHFLLEVSPINVSVSLTDTEDANFSFVGKLTEDLRRAERYAKTEGRRIDAYVLGYPISFWRRGNGGRPDEQIFSFPMNLLEDKKESGYRR